MKNPPPFCVKGWGYFFGRGRAYLHDIASCLVFFVRLGCLYMTCAMKFPVVSAAWSCICLVA